jgi:hypothetical protein
MRKLLAAATLAALGVALLAIPASASFDHHFTVWEKASFHQTSTGVIDFKGKLFKPRSHDRVGRDHGTCKPKPNDVTECRTTAHLNGEIGGFGDIKFKGNLSEHDNRVNVIGGSDDFNGVAGKVLLTNVHGTTTAYHFALVR